MFSETFREWPLEAQEQYWEQVLEIAEADRREQTDHLALMEKSGLAMPPAEELDEEALSERLWEVIGWMESNGVFIEHTDHLDDRAFYEYLRTEGLREPIPDKAPDPNEMILIDVLSEYDEYRPEDIRTLAEYYADDPEHLDMFHEWFPDEPLPEPKPRPANRDKDLPKPEWR